MACNDERSLAARDHVLNQRGIPAQRLLKQLHGGDVVSLALESLDHA
jgi:hypothetical protein